MLTDLRSAIRMLLKSPGFSLVAIATLALGIGANTAIFSVVQSSLLRSLPFPRADRLVRLYELAGENGDRIFTTGAIKKAHATFVFIEELDPRGYEINSFMVNHYPSNSWTDVPGNMHINAGIISFADGHAIIWPFADPRTYRNPQIGMATPNDPDLRQIQAWVGSGPFPPGVVQ